MTLIDREYDLNKSRVWKPIGKPREDGFQPAVKRTYRLRCAPIVLGELSFSHFIDRGRVALYLFEPLTAHESYMQQLVGLEHVEEVA